MSRLASSSSILFKGTVFFFFVFILITAFFSGRYCGLEKEVRFGSQTDLDWSPSCHQISGWSWRTKFWASVHYRHSAYICWIKNTFLESLWSCTTPSSPLFSFLPLEASIDYTSFPNPQFTIASSNLSLIHYLFLTYPVSNLTQAFLQEEV